MSKGRLSLLERLVTLKIKSANIDNSSQISEANIKGQFINDVITGGEGWGISQKMTNDDRMTARFWT